MTALFSLNEENGWNKEGLFPVKFQEEK